MNRTVCSANNAATAARHPEDAGGEPGKTEAKVPGPGWEPVSREALAAAAVQDAVGWRRQPSRTRWASCRARDLRRDFQHCTGDEPVRSLEP